MTEFKKLLGRLWRSHKCETAGCEHVGLLLGKFQLGR
jgi:hypothetical protein